MLVNAQPPPNGYPGGVPPPDGQDCCRDFEGDDPDNPPQAWRDCMADPVAYCTIPIDNSRYVYISMVAGVALASFVIARAVERKNKKTPM